MTFRLFITDEQIVSLLEPCVDLHRMSEEESDAWFEEQYSCLVNYDRNALFSWFIDFDTELEMIEFKLRHL